MLTLRYRKSIAMCGAVLLSSAALLTIVAPSQAFAEQRPVVVTGRIADADTVTRRVSYGDLDLAARGGEKTLYWRVGGAVRSLCFEATGSDGTGIYVFADHACQMGAWAGARPQIARAVLRARQLADTGSTTIAATAITITVP